MCVGRADRGKRLCGITYSAGQNSSERRPFERRSLREIFRAEHDQRAVGMERLWDHGGQRRMLQSASFAYTLSAEHGIGQLKGTGCA